MTTFLRKLMERAYPPEPENEARRLLLEYLDGLERRTYHELGPLRTREEGRAA